VVVPAGGIRTDQFAPRLLSGVGGVPLQRRGYVPAEFGIRIGQRRRRTRRGQQRQVIDEQHPGARRTTAHLTPDRPPSDALSYEANGPGALVFAPATDDASNPCVWISDARYADFSAEVAFSSDFSPSLRLAGRDFVAPGAPNSDSACPLPTLADGSRGGRLQIERLGPHVALTIADAHSECWIGNERLSVGVCASELGTVRVTRVSVTRTN
jgi:hypothetical protein